MPKLLRRVLVGLGIVYVTYLIVGNVLLLSKLPLRWINGAQENVTLSYDWAVSLVPSHLFAGGVVFTSKDSAIEMMVTSDSASTWISVPAAFQMTYRMWGSTEGGSVRIRNRRPLAELCAPGAQHLPPIAGMTHPIVAGDRASCLAQRDTAMPLRDAPADPQTLWRIDLRGVEAANLHELWFEDLRVAGRMHGDVSFFLWPTSELRIDPAGLTVDTATIGLGQELADGIPFQGQVEVQLRETELGDGELERLIGNTTATVTVEAAPRRLGLFAPPEVELAASRGRVRAKVVVDRGVLRPGTDVLVEDVRVTARAAQHRASVAGGVRAAVGADGELTARLDLAAMSLRHERADAPLLTGEDLSVSVRAARPEVLRPLRRASLDVALRALEVPDMVVLNETLGATGPFRFHSGKAMASGELKVREGRRIESGRFHLESSDVVAAYDDLLLQGRFVLDMPLLRAEDRLDASGTTLVVRDGKVQQPKDGVVKNVGWWARLELPEARLDLSPAVRLESRIRGRVASIRPLIAVFGAQGTLPELVRDFDPGETDAAARLTVTKRGVALEQVVVDASGFDVAANFYAHDGTTDGGLLIALGPFKVGVEVKKGQTEVNVLSPTQTFHANAAGRRRLLQEQTSPP